MTDHYNQQSSHTEQLNEVINNLRDENQRLESVNASAMLVISRIRGAAVELGYNDDTDVDQLQYIIELARATVMVNDRNLELTKKIIELTPGLDNALDEEWRRRI